MEVGEVRQGVEVESPQQRVVRLGVRRRDEVAEHLRDSVPPVLDSGASHM